MKKLLSILLALLLLLSLCACDSNEEKDSENSVELSIGETFETENWKFTLKNIAFGDELGNVTESKSGYLMPDGQKYWQTPYTAEEGKTFVVIDYTLQYLGKEKTQLRQNNISINYDDGYTFSDFSKRVAWSGSIFEDRYTDVLYEPLEDAKEFREIYEVPDAVADNTDKPLSITVSFNKTDYIYKVR